MGKLNAGDLQTAITRFYKTQPVFISFFLEIQLTGPDVPDESCDAPDLPP